MSRKCLYVITCFLTIVTLSGAANAQSQIPFQDGVVTGVGWDSYRGQHTARSCVVFELYKETGIVTDVDYQQVDDTTSLLNTFKMSASAKVGFAMGGGGASASFARSTRITTTGTNIAVHVLTLYGSEYVVPRGTARNLKSSSSSSIRDAPKRPTSEFLRTGSIHLTPQARVWARKDLRRFRQECGDSYISGTSRGSGINGVAVADTRSEEERQSFSAAVQGNYGPVGAKAEVEKAVESMATQNRVHITYVQLGGSGMPTSTDIKSFRALVEKIGSAAAPSDTNAPKTVMEYRPYTELGDYKSAAGASGDAEAIVDQYLRLLTLTRWASVDIITEPNKYDLSQDTKITAVADMATKANSDMVTLRTTLAACNPRGCSFPAGLPRDDYLYRTKLPLTLELARPWAESQSIRAQLADVNASIATTSATVSRWVCDVPPVPLLDNCPANIGHYENDPNPTYQALTASLGSLQKRLNDLGLVLDDAETRFRVYIAEPNRRRCQDLLQQTGCITGAELNGYRAQMVQSN